MPNFHIYRKYFLLFITLIILIGTRIIFDKPIGWKTYNGQYIDYLGFFYPANLEITEGDTSNGLLINLIDPNGEEELEIGEESRYELIYTPEEGGMGGYTSGRKRSINEDMLYHKELEFSKYGLIEDKDKNCNLITNYPKLCLKGMSSPSASMADHMVTKMLIWADNYIITITNWRSPENDQVFQKIIRSIRLTNQAY